MKSAFITGASKGIGKSIATILAKNGYSLALLGNQHMSDLNELAKTLEKEYSITIFTYQCDLKDSAKLEKLCAQALNDMGHFDLIINNAGIAHVGLFDEMSIAEWNDLFAINMTSCFITCKVLAKDMINKKQGHIINISSMWGTVGASCEVAYSASKGALNSFTKALAKELAPSNISVNAIACGVVDTEMNSHLDDNEKKELSDDIPASRFASTDEIAEVVLKICESPTYLTGQIIGVDGGYI